jgi:hypothetical protein
MTSQAPAPEWAHIASFLTALASNPPQLASSLASPTTAASPATTAATTVAPPTPRGLAAAPAQVNPRFPMLSRNASQLRSQLLRRYGRSGGGIPLSPPETKLSVLYYL